MMIVYDLPFSLTTKNAKEGKNYKMRFKEVVSLLLLFYATGYLCAQQDYNAYYQQMNPAPDSLSTEEKLVVMQDFLNDALLEKDTIRIIHGNLYLANILSRNADFSATIDLLLEAERWAKLQDNQLLLGRIYHRKATVYTYLEDYDRAIKDFEIAIAHHLVVKDSQYLGITYEQLGATYSYIDSFEIANKYYQLAIPVIEKHASKNSLAVTFANYGNVFSYQDSMEAAIRLYQQALVINTELGDLYQTSPCLTNIADQYRKLGRYQEALALYHQAVHLDRANGWMYYLYMDYDGLAVVHEELGQFDSAIHYHHLYEHLRDSISGAEVQTDITRQEAELTSEEQADLLFTEKSRTRSIVIGAGLLILFLGIGLLISYLQNRAKSRQLVTNRERLITLTKVLQTKNRASLNVNNPVNQTKDPTRKPSPPPVFDPYDTRILKTEDWTNFKLIFEKSYPGYLRQLRITYSDLSEAEERLFLLLKLNLTTSEVANTLGIRQESVKKTRTRLRKRLQLKSSDSLAKFISEF